MNLLILYAQIKEEKHQSLLDYSFLFFPKKYQEKLLRYRRWQDAQLSLLGRLLLKEGMTYFKVPLNFNDLKLDKYNKPYLENSNIKFNISHSGDIVVISITGNYNSNIGIDVEENNIIKIEDFKGQMTIKEQQKVFFSANPLHEFFAYWTQKEAVLKAHGKGLQVPLKSFEIENGKAQIDNDIFYVSEVELKEGYTCHLASQSIIDKGDIAIKKISTNKFIKA